MVLTLPLDFVQMMHCHMEQSVLMKIQLILRMIFVDQKLGNKRRWNSILQSVRSCALQPKRSTKAGIRILWRILEEVDSQPYLSLRSKRFRLVFEQGKTEERDSGLWPRKK